MAYKQFFTDRKFLLPLAVVVVFELSLQAGCYKPLLKKNSYAANVNRIVNHVIDKQEEFDPNVLVFGTSVGYQGLSVRILNDQLRQNGVKLNSIAIPGSELIVQELAMEKALDHFKNIKTVVHVMEVTMPWVNHDDLSLPTLAMVSEFNRIRAVEKLYQHEYDVKYDDIAYVLTKSFAYRRDMRDLFLHLDRRVKDLGRELKNPNREIYDYENSYHQKISSYPVSDLENCKTLTGPQNLDPVPPTSDQAHKRALFDTCSLALVTTVPMESTPKSEKYFRRLQKLYSVLQKRNIRIINVFAPYSSLLNNLRGKERIVVWQRELEKSLGKENVTIIDLQDIFENKNSGDYFYDLIHLNRAGMVEFSNHLGKKLGELKL